MPYVPNATDTTEPLESQTVESAALEFRTLKTRVNALAASVAADDLTDLRVPEAGIAVLPAVAERAGKVLGFDAGGDPTMVEVSGASDPSLRSDLAASSGASLVGYLPAGMGAVASTVEATLRAWASLSGFGGSPGASSATNDAAFAAALAYLATQGGGTLHVGPGDHATSAAITSTANNIHLELDHNCGIVFTSADYVALKFTGTNCRVTGGHARGFIGPAAWDGANVAPTYGVLWMGGAGAYVSTRLSNVRKVGVWFKDVNNCTAEGCVIEGNYPSAQWTGVETVNYGVAFDPDADASGGNFKLVNNTVKSCVQGVFAGNYGTGGVIQGLVITGNIFEGCWNHGIYSNYTNGAIVSGNSFNRCQTPVVCSGRYNNVTGNTLYTATDTVGDQRDLVGISVRDPQFCVISGNTIKGVVDASNSVCINLQYFAGVVGPIDNNIVSNNTIDITAGVCTPIRIEPSSAFGTTQCNNNVISGNTVRASCGSDGAIFVDGIATGANSGNIVSNNSVVVLAGSFGIKLVNQVSATILGNSVEWRYDSGTPGSSVMTVSLAGTSSLCSVESNSTIVTFQFGLNLVPYGLREYDTANSNKCFNNHDKVDTTKSSAITKVLPVANSLMDIQETGLGAPTMPARIGSIWRRYPFGGPGATLYVKESATDGTGWMAK